MKVLDLFAGTRSISRAFEERGHETYSIDWDRRFVDVDLHEDICKVTARQILRTFGKPDVIWASPDCSSYSVAAIGHHRLREADGNLAPVTDYAQSSDKLNMYVHNLMLMLSPPLWFIENPRGAMRKMAFMRGLERYTVTYCKYGDDRMKPTDIWTNHPDPRFEPPCKNGDPCHKPAPRGSRTGTQGLAGSVERARIPKALCDHIVRISEEVIEPNGLREIQG